MARRSVVPQRGFTPSAILALLGIILRRLRGEVLLLAVVLAVVFVASLIFTALPRYYNRMSDEGLVYDIENANIFQRNLQAQILTQVEPAQDDTFAQVELTGDNFLAGLPESIRNVVVDSNWVLDSPRYAIGDVPGAQVSAFERYMRFRYQSEVNDHIRLVSGAFPAPQGTITPPCVGECPPTDEEWELFEVAISEETAGQLSLTVGDQLILTPDRTDPNNRARDFASVAYSVVLEISGTFEPIAPLDQYWFADTRLQRADMVETPETTIYYATSLLAPDDYARLLNLNQNAQWTYAYRHYVDPNRFDGGQLPQLAHDVRNAEFTYSGTGGAAAPGEFFLQTGLSGLFNRFEARQQQTVAILSLAAIGLLAVTLSVIGLLAALIAARRRETTALLRGRGASRRQLILGQLSEGLLLATPCVLLGYVAAVAAVDARPSTWSLLAAIAMIVAVALVLILAALPYFRAPLRDLEHQAPASRRTPLRRILLEVTVIGLAVAGVVLLRRRGISPESSVGDGAGFDPYLAAVPVLLGLAIGLLALRLYPLPVRFFAWLSALGRDLTLFVGLRRVAGQAGTSRLPLLVILLAVALAVFSTVLQRSIDEGQVAASWQTVGAPFRVEPPAAGGILSSNIDLINVDGVEAIAAAHITDASQITTSTRQGAGNIRVMAIDTEIYQRVVAGTPIEPHFPDAMLGQQIVTDIGTESNPIPAIVSANWPIQPAPQTGDTFRMYLRSLDVTFIVRDVRDRFAGMPLDEPFMVTSLDSVSQIERGARFRPSALFIRAEPGAEEALRSTLQGQSRFSRLTSQDALYGRVSDAPLTYGVSIGFRLGVALATACAALAAIVALALTSRERARDLAYLRTMGLSTSQATLLTMVELLPPVLIAAIVGAGLGVVTVQVVEPGIDINAFTGEGLPAKILVDWSSVALVAGIVVASTILAIAVFGAATRRTNLGQTLRVGD